MTALEKYQLIVLALLVLVICFGSIAKWLNLPYPIVLVIAGLAVSLLPQLPRIPLNASMIFVGVLPPLLFSAAFTTSWREFRYNLASIALLAFGLVGFTVLGVAVAAHMLLPEFDWRLGLVLGAVVAPTDAIAATAIGKRLGLPKQIISILEGESLINDASGLIALQLATSLIVAGTVPTLLGGIGDLLYLLSGGIAAGLLVGKLVDVIGRKLDDAPIEVTMTLVIPYVAYLSAEAIHCSGVLAAVAAGLYLGQKKSSLFSSVSRLESHSFWNTFTYVLNSLVFLLIGLQLPYILAEIRSMPTRILFIDAAEFVVAVISLRLIWVYPGAYVANLVRTHIQKQPDAVLHPRGVFVMGWTGMRGVIALAAAISLPQSTADGSPFPQRNVIIFLTFCVIFVTLVVQGLTLPSLIRALGLAQRSTVDPEERRARTRMVKAALQQLDAMKEESSGSSEVYDDIRRYYERRLAFAQQGDGEETDPASRKYEDLYHSISNKLRAVERATALEMRDKREISDGVLHVLERELDLLDLRYAEH
ncbi:MAG: Na+/H+ antiporter [Bryobacteraceae bacterium]